MSRGGIFQLFEKFLEIYEKICKAMEIFGFSTVFVFIINKTM